MSSTRDFMEIIGDLHSDFQLGRDLARHQIALLFQSIDLLEEQRAFWEKHCNELEQIQREAIAEFRKLNQNNPTGKAS